MIVLGFLLGFGLNIVLANVYTNPLLLQEAIRTEYQLFQKLQDLELPLTGELEVQIAEYLTGLKTIQDDVGVAVSTINLKDMDNPLLNLVVGNALHVFNLSYRVVKQLPSIVQGLKMQHEDKAKPFLQHHQWARRKKFWPKDKDLEGSSLALSRIQAFYQLNTDHLASGILGQIATSARLSWQACQFLSQQRIDSSIGTLRQVTNDPEFSLAIAWMNTALNLCQETESECEDLEQELAQLIAKHDEHLDAFVKGGNDTNLYREKFLTQQSQDEPELRDASIEADFKVDPIVAHNLQHLCIESTKPFEERMPWAGHCHFWDKGLDALKLMPLKTERLGRPALGFIIHDLLSEAEVQRIKLLSLQQSLKFNRADDTLIERGREYEFRRTQSSSWISDLEPFMFKINLRLERVTGLKVANDLRPNDDNFMRQFNSEPLQVGLYPPGGAFLPHIDAHNGDYSPWVEGNYIGERMATAMFFLSDVIGGGTAFPRFGSVATPTPGSLLFWYNLHPDGSQHKLSLHAGCPTLFGLKWVANKWIHEPHQFLLRPCGLTSAAAWSWRHF